MNIQHLLTALLLMIGVGFEWICCLGVLKAPTVFNRLHYLGPATIIGPMMVAAAVIVSGAQWQNDVKAVLVMLLVLMTSPVLTHATARAARLRDWGDLNPRPEDQE